MMTYRTDQPLKRGDIVHHRETGELGTVVCSPWWNEASVLPVRRVLVRWEDEEGTITMPSDVACIGQVERNGITIWHESWPINEQTMIDEEEAVERIAYAKEKALYEATLKRMVQSFDKQWQ